MWQNCFFFAQILRCNSETTRNKSRSYNRKSTDIRMRSIKRCHFQWPWVTQISISRSQHLSKSNILVPTGPMSDMGPDIRLWNRPLWSISDINASLGFASINWASCMFYCRPTADFKKKYCLHNADDTHSYRLRFGYEGTAWHVQFDHRFLPRVVSFLRYSMSNNIATLKSQ